MKARAVFQGILSDMVQLFQAVSVYPESHMYVREPLTRLHRRLQEEAHRLGTFSIGFFGDQVVIEQIPFLATTAGVRRLIRKMNARGIEKVEIGEGIDAEELKRFILLVSCAPPDAPEGEWRSLVFGRIKEVGEDGPVGPTPGDSAPQILDGAVTVLKEVLRSVAVDSRRSGVGDGRDIVSTVMKALREEEFLVDRILRLQAHDDYTVTHSLNVCVLVVAQATRWGFPNAAIQDAGLAALLHDIGKELVPGEILNKPGKLNGHEFARLSLHPTLGAAQLKKLSIGTDLPVIVCYEHHIRYNRSGYPKVHYTDPLHPVSLMTQVADVYDALRTYRPYRPSLDQETTIGILGDGRGTEFDPVLLDRFLEMIAR